MSAADSLKRPPSIHSRLLIGLLLPLVAVATLVSIETFRHARATSVELHDQTLLSVLLVVAENTVASEGDLLSENILEALAVNLGDPFFYHVAGAEGSLITGYAGTPPLRGQRPEVRTEPFFFDSVYQGDPVRVVIFEQFVSQPEISGWITVTAWQRTGERERLSFELFNRSIVRLVVVIASAGVIVWFALSFGLKPLKTLERSIERRSPDDLKPIEAVPPAEIDDMVAAMNRLFLQLGRANQVRERFIGDAAHQMRNPIAAIKTQCQAALASDDATGYRASLANILDVTESTGLVVEQLLLSARTHARGDRALEDFDPGEVLGRAARTLAPQALKKGFDLALEIERDDLQLRGDPRLLEAAIVNLLDNAIRHSPPGGRITAGLRVEDGARAVQILVADAGPALEASQFERLLQPFATGDGDSPGSGLGLAVVDDVARMHGGRLLMRPARDGAGKEIVISLPLARAEDAPG